jgi:hypothetical protein
MFGFIFQAVHQTSVSGVDVVYPVFIASIVLCLWAVADASLRPKAVFQAVHLRKAVWIAALVIGLCLFGIVGGIVGIIYLVGVRPKLKVSGTTLSG